MQILASTAEELCLEFANTVHWHASSEPMDTLHTYADLLDWARQQGIIDDAASLLLAKISGEQPTQAKDVYRRAIALREAIYSVFTAHVHGNAPPGDDLAVINRELREALAHTLLESEGAEFSWQWDTATDAQAQVLWPVVRSAADLLTSAEKLARVGQCADDRGCGWFFLDLSKNHSRRWCNINDCGNRAKQQRHRRKQQ